METLEKKLEMLCKKFASSEDKNDVGRSNCELVSYFGRLKHSIGAYWGYFSKQESETRGPYLLMIARDPSVSSLWYSRPCELYIYKRNKYGKEYKLVSYPFSVLHPKPNEFIALFNRKHFRWKEEWKSEIKKGAYWDVLLREAVINISASFWTREHDKGPFWYYNSEDYKKLRVDE